MKRYEMTLTALSPIHIGAGEEISPFEYVIRKIEQADNQPFLFRIDLPRFLADLSPDLRQKFDYAVQRAGTVYMRKFIADHADPFTYQLYLAPVGGDLADLYFAKLDSPDNQLTINPTMRRLDTWQPLIPGSSIKGAIRTAVVSAAVNQKAKKENYRPDLKNRHWEGEVLGNNRDIRSDPFRAVSVEDVSLPRDAISIDTGVIFKPDIGDKPDPGGIQQFYERTFSILDDEPDITGTAILGIQDHLNRRNAVSLPLNAECLAAVCKKFYLPKMESDHNRFYCSRRDLDKINRPLIDQFGSEAHYGPLEFPIRLGHFSHCECVTVDTFRDPKTRLDISGTTRTLVNREMPFGWAKISLKPLD